MEKATNIKTTPSFEEAALQLEQILDAISKETTPLDESIELYAKAADLINLCNTTLNEAQVKIHEISEKIVLPEETV